MKNSEIAPAALTKLSFDRNVNSEFPNNNNDSYCHFYLPKSWKGEKPHLFKTWQEVKNRLSLT